MDKTIGIGAIVGLTFFSCRYIWLSKNFTSLQKTALLILLIFPPAQWLGILIASLYNSNVANNSVEKVQDRKLEQVKFNLNISISNLTDLKNKGILSEEEYFQKVAKIKTEKAQQEIKGSVEYKQLKSLFDSGYLTKEEFESKIKKIKNLETVHKSTKLPNSDDKPIKQDNDIVTYMVKLILATAIIMSIIWGIVILTSNK